VHKHGSVTLNGGNDAFGQPHYELVINGTNALKGSVVPLPVRLTVCELPMALVEILSEPVRVPVAVGAKVIVIVQEAPAASVAGKLVGQVPAERAKSPLTVMLFRLSTL
jgi:hypothetical protein